MRDERANRNSVSGEDHGNFAACRLTQAGVRALNRDHVPWLRRSCSAGVFARAARKEQCHVHLPGRAALQRPRVVDLVIRGFSRRGRQRSTSRVSPVVKRRVTSHQSTTYDGSRECQPCRGAALRECRDPEGSGGVVPKHRVAAANGLESILFSLIPQREMMNEWEGHEFTRATRRRSDRALAPEV